MVALARLSLLRAALGSLVAAVCACSSDAVEPSPTPINPGGGETSLIAGLPPGWFGGNQNPLDYELGRDVGVFRSGQGSAYLRSKGRTAPPNTFIALIQAVRGDFIRGRRVRLSGYIRASEVGGEGIGLWLRVDAATRTRGFDNMADRRQLGTRDWEYAEIVLDVPDDALGVHFGALLSGEGIGRIDDLKFETVGPEVAVTAPVLDGPPTYPDSAGMVASYERLPFEPVNLDFEGILLPESQSAAVEWVRSNSFTFETDDPAASDADLAPLQPLIGTARLVALGESTHGTRQFFRMKHRVFKYLVQHFGFDHFSIEASLPEALAVDWYVQTGVGDPAALVRGMGFWTWSTEEVIDLVRWMRSWNATCGSPRVRFSGFDMQNPRVAIDSVVAFGSTIQQALGDSIRVAYSCLDAARIPNALSFSTTQYRALSGDVQASCRASIASIDSLFARRLETWKSAAGEERTQLMQRLARLVSQWEDHVFSGARDRYMAENVAWWRARTGGAGMMLWAHNAHVSRHPIWMGAELRKMYGADYLNVALTFSAGSFNAVLQLPNGAFGGLQVHQVGGSWPGSIEAMMDATGHTRAIFDTRATVTGDAIGQSLRRRMTIRQIGAVFSPGSALGIYQTSLAVPDDYDLVIWFRDATASRLSLSAVVGQDASSVRPLTSTSRSAVVVNR